MSAPDTTPLPPRSAQTLTERLEAIHGLLSDKLPRLARIAVALYDANTDMLHTLAHSSRGEDPLSHYGIALSEVPSLRELLRQGGPRIANDLEAAYFHGSEHSRRIIGQGYRSSYTAVLSHRDAVLGFVFFNSYEAGQFDERALPIVECAARLVALTIGEDLDATRILMGAIVALGKVARVRDPETGEHLERMARFSREIALRLAEPWGLTDEFVENVFLYAPLHDIGKLAMPDAILFKPEGLDPGEWEIMRQHPAQTVVIGQGSVVHEALVLPGRERVRAHGGDRRFGGHAGMTDAMRAMHLRQFKAMCHIFGQSDLLVDFKAVADAHDLEVGAQMGEG